jgi:hypothetical protein
MTRGINRSGCFHGLCIASLLATCGCGFFHDPNGPGSLQAITKAEKSAEETLKGQGAILERKQYPPGSAWAVDLSGQDVTEITFEALKRLDHIAELDLSKTKITDEHMKHFADSAFAGVLVDLNLSNTEVSDAGLNELRVSRFLTNLNLTGTKVTEEGAARWQKARSADDTVSPNFKKVRITR